MKSFTILMLGTLASAFSQANTVNIDNIDLEKARAYQAYVMTFVWPDNMSSEAVNYQDVFSLDGIERYFDDTGIAVVKEPEGSPFANFQNTIAARTKMLSNETWTLIFPDTGSTIHETFHSQVEHNGYPEFTASVSFTLNRYLESNLHYKHYQFGNPAVVMQPDLMTNQNADQGYVTMPAYAETTQAQQGNWDGPTQELALHFTNKTASKKLNYVDHPIIGTLIYFEPLELEQALDLTSSR